MGAVKPWGLSVRCDRSSESGDCRVSVEAEASSLLRQLAGEPVHGAGNVKAAIRGAAMRAGFTFSRTRKLWYREARSILAIEMDQLRERAQAANHARDNALRTEAGDIIARLARLEADLAALSGELARAQVVDTSGSARDGGAGAS